MSQSNGNWDHDRHGVNEHHDDIVYPAAIPFIVVHLVCFAAIWTGVTALALWMAVALYIIRMWAITAGFHRYFSHRSYKTSRWFQFVLAFLGQTCAQRGVLWWSALHRHHHRHSDTEHDVHSPVGRGLFFSHVGWIFVPRRAKADYSTVPDLTRYPELVWLDRHPYVPAFLLALACFLIGGWPGLIVGFFWSTVVLYHGAFSINSLAHTVGRKKYVTGDQSRNNWFLALITLGEGWHNNHHAYQSSTRQGFRWWEIDISYYVLWLMARVGLVWDLRAPPRELVHGRQRLGRRVIERVAEELAQSFPVDRVSQRVKERWSNSPSMDELRTRAVKAKAQVEAYLAGMSIPELPSVEELKTRADEARAELARKVAEIARPELPSIEDLKASAARHFQDAARHFEDTPSLDEIAARAREMIIESVCMQIMDEPLRA